ncbi:class I SAM-dependent methyltransferase, partial [Pedobacter sp.]
MGIDCYDKVCLEPSSGKGDIIDYLNQNGAAEVLCCESNEDLALISANKGQLVANDFFTLLPEEVSHVNLIVMNPPFSNADKHILHAWNIAPEGCEIIAL